MPEDDSVSNRECLGTTGNQHFRKANWFLPRLQQGYFEPQSFSNISPKYIVCPRKYMTTNLASQMIVTTINLPQGV